MCKKEDGNKCLKGNLKQIRHPKFKERRTNLRNNGVTKFNFKSIYRSKREHYLDFMIGMEANNLKPSGFIRLKKFF